MDLRRDNFKRIALAPAKLNLFLEVLGRRPDGFHDLETLMVPLRLSDTVAFTATPPQPDHWQGAILLDVRTCWPVRSPPHAEEIPGGPDNLVVKALELLQRRSGCGFGAKVDLVKRIPAASGLGGGSSDAATALQLANHAWQINWSRGQLAEVAAELGSDVPFFLQRSAAVCRGRGEEIEPLPGVDSLYFVIVRPPVGLGTREVYRALDDLAEPGARCGAVRLNKLLAILTSGRWRDLGIAMHNRLQAAAASLSPWVERLRTIFNGLDCLGHQLSGSGSAYFGVCRHAQHARRLAGILKTRQLGLVYTTGSCPYGRA